MNPKYVYEGQIWYRYAFLVCIFFCLVQGLVEIVWYLLFSGDTTNNSGRMEVTHLFEHRFLLNQTPYFTSS